MSSSGDNGINKMTDDDSQRETFSFSAAGWLQIYHHGVGKALQDSGIADNTNVRYVGSSAGSIVSAGLVSRVDCEEMRDFSLELCADCHSNPSNAFRGREMIGKGIKHFAVSNFNKQVNGELTKRLEDQLEVYATVLPGMKKKVITKFEVVEDLEEALYASCCIAPIAGWPFRLRKTGELVCDGGLVAFQPRSGEPNVITVSPFYFTTADIKPDVFIPAWWSMYPPSIEKFYNVYNIAYNDAIHFLVRTNRVSKRMLRRLKPTLGHKEFLPPLIRPALPEESSQMRIAEQKQTGFVSRVVFATTGVTAVPEGEGGAASVSRASMPARAVFKATNVLVQASYLAVDLMAAVVFFCMMRPVALFVIYGELFVVSGLCLIAALLQHIPFFGRKLRHTRRVAQKKKRQQQLDAQQQDGDIEHPHSMSELMNTTVVYTYRGAWKELYLVWRNIVSLRVLMHVVLGTHVEINNRRLEKHSRLYRVLRPFL